MMKKSLSKILLAAGLATVGAPSAFAQSAKAETQSKPTTSATPTKVTEKTETDKVDKPATTPGWIVVEENWWVPLRYDFSTSIHSARVHYRSGQEQAAAAEIEKARTWLSFAQNHANKSTQEDLATANADLEDFALQLKAGKGIKPLQLESAFAHASAALSKYHHFLSKKAAAKGDLKRASLHLKSAVEHLRDAANSANYEYGKDIVEFYDSYWPFGRFDETVVVEKSELEKSLDIVEAELLKISAKLK